MVVLETGVMSLPFKIPSKSLFVAIEVFNDV
jgi:hypothetical protein